MAVVDDLSSIAKIASSGMRAQSQRLRITSENMANADSTGSTPGSDPYQRKTISFGNMVDDQTGANLVSVDKVSRDPSDFRLVYDPSHPAADAAGYVKMPNVNSLVELGNMREASRSYEANLNMLETGRNMKSQLIGMLDK
ncbi:flagellar basal body rod protein FlgC [Paracoccus litorisediminis]|uniref:flagellar basal body rod protein FlgC n=1 Tax=Paracoccus litorisediminis TaxID=2006130 RepID=UPI003735EB5F